MIREIVRLGNPLLREVCAEVQDPAGPSVAEVVEDLRDTLRNSRETTGYGRAIAAPQIGVTKRIIFLNVDHPWPLINPVITHASEETIVVWDACLSFLSIFMQVRRHKYITVRYQDPAGGTHEFAAGPDQDYAELLQHEIDHLDGVLCVDRVEDNRTICSKEEFELRYKPNSPYA